jgi:hypothetical protein
MLVTTRLVNNTSVERMVKLWAERYVPDLSTLSAQKGYLAGSDLVAAASPEGRTQTVAKLKRIIEIHCKCAGIQTTVLFSYIPKIVNLTESQGIARAAGQVYEKVLEVYQEPLSAPAFLRAMPLAETVDFSTDAFWSLVKLQPPVVQQLAITLEPVLLQFQEQHLSSTDKRALGFMSTQFHLSSKLLLNRLTLSEQLLLSPYFKFVEEQVCIPWQRVCTAAAKYSADSPALSLVAQLLPKSREIASKVYHQATQLFPHYRSRRGRLTEPGVKASSLRDIEMFQAYLCLCVLEQSMAVVEQELHPLCAMVYPSVDVTWELVDHMLKQLVDEIFARVEPAHKRLLLPYTSAMQQLFCDHKGN